jgi:DNA replication and repair protein RecF
MRLRSLSISNLRVVESAGLQIEADLVVFAGANGSGKSSVLEAIHILGTGRSFRARSIHDVIRRDASRLLVHGETELASGASCSVGVEKRRGGSARFRLAGEDVRAASALAHNLPLVLVTPDSQRLLTDGAEGRRRLLDWLLFHVEPGYQSAHARYRRALRQRNAMLRQRETDPQQRLLWCSELAAAGAELGRHREEGLTPVLATLGEELSRLTDLQVELGYEPGWDARADLGRLLMDDWAADESRGFTGNGPHRADLRLRVGGRPARHVASRGESKLLAAGVLVSFAKVLGQRAGARKPLVLVDELASELDGANRERFSRALLDLGMQTFVTTVSEELLSRAGWARVQVFHMDRGEVVPVLQ